MDKDLLKVLENYEDKTGLQNDTKTLTDIVKACVADKVEVITEDEFDTGRRQILNFGHTIGHVIERDSNFTKDHGVCVAMGMGIITDACLAAGLTDKATRDRMISLIEAYGLPSGDGITPDEAVAGVMNDKKKRGNTISLIIVKNIGEAEIAPMDPEGLHNFLSRR
jgi:3-dehydroquinate synthase